MVLEGEDAVSRLFGMRADDFARSLWERAPAVKRKSELDVVRGAAELKEGLPTWDDLLQVVDRAQEVDLVAGGPCAVIVLKDQTPTTEYPSAAAAYLDGCSIIVNHADRASCGIALFCQKLRSSFPHAYAQLYVTPSRAQAVQAHADDRDVFVIQLGGSKNWQVYQEPPVPFPMPDEQVGKAGKAVPKHALENAVVETTLQTGDVLYIPRGFVHQASTDEDQPSFHLTVALATHDWAWASMGRYALRSYAKDAKAAEKFFQKVLQDQKSEEQSKREEREPHFWRRSMPPALVCSDFDQKSRDEAKKVAAGVEEELGLQPAGDVLSSLLKKLVQVHNKRQDEALRMSAAQALLGSSKNPALSTTSWVRRRKEGEKAASRREGYEGAMGLIAREEIADTLLSSLGKITTEPFAVSLLGDCPLLCPFSRACFAQVCVDMSILVECRGPGEQDSEGEEEEEEESSEEEEDSDDDDDDDDDENKRVSKRAIRDKRPSKKRKVV